MSTCYQVTDLLSLTMASFQYPDAWVGVSRPGAKAPKRAAAEPFCMTCLSSSSVANAKLKQLLREEGAVIYVFPTYADLCAVQYDVASPKCRQCRGPKNELDKGKA
jgi:hypothetical protein